MIEKKYDVIIIGGGPGGYSAAIKAAKEGLKTLLFEGENIGGTCLNVGCIPTKYLLDKAASIEKIRQLAGDGTLEAAGFYSFKKIQKGKSEVVKKLTGGVRYLLKANGVTVVEKPAVLKEPTTVECEGTLYKGENIIIATGSEAAKIPVLGADHTVMSKEALELLKVPRRLVVIGGGVIGMELASAYCSFGSKVTVIEVLSELFPMEDRKAVSYLERELKKQGIQILCGTKVKEVRKTDAYLVGYESVDGRSCGEVPADVVLMATGRNPSFRGIDVERLGLELTEKGELAVNEFMQTSLPHVYAVGDVTGGYQLAHAAYAEGETAVAHILGKEAPVDFCAIPRCIYTIPPFAAVGLGEKEAKEQGIEVAVGEFPYTGNGMALAEGANGVVRVIMDPKDQTTLGAQIVGACAPEMISFASLAVKKRLTFEEWQQLLVAHPSLSEMVKEAACDCFGKSIHGKVKV